ncbi:MAG: hypothetical protein SWH78_17200 [Thermodesulfobacteriota bacterium]|nr:hypothetical protein [Thermodesulfobacteriota bacterium]
MKTRHQHRTIMDLERVNRFNAEGCLACGKKFSLGDAVVMACGKWEGLKYIHENEAVLDPKTGVYFERRHRGALRRGEVEAG